MRQQVEVKSVGADGYAQVEAVRRSACSGDCDHCGGCASAKQHVLVRAKNPIGAAVGDQVIVETSSRAILGAAAVVYLVPLALLLLGYGLASILGVAVWLCCLAGFFLGVLLVIAYIRYVTKRGRLEFTITAFVGR